MSACPHGFTRSNVNYDAIMAVELYCTAVAAAAAAAATCRGAEHGARTQQARSSRFRSMGDTTILPRGPSVVQAGHRVVSHMDSDAHERSTGRW